MKTRLFAIISIISSIFTSCQQIDLSKDESDARGNLIVTLQYNQKNSGFETARSAVSKSVSSVASRIEYVIMQNGKVLQTSEQVSGSDSDFGTFSATLDPGDYQLVVFAHNCAASVTVSNDGIITCPDDKATDSFCTTTDFTIVKGERTTLDCQLNRCVSQLFIKSDDAIPSDVTGLILTLTGATTTFDGVNQKGVVGDPVVKNVTDISYVKDSSTGCLNLNTYLFLSESESEIDVTLEFVKYNQTTQKNETVASRTLTGVQLATNTQSTINARMFADSAVECSITANADWSTPIYQNF